MSRRIGDDLLIKVLECRANEEEQREVEVAIQEQSSLRLRMEQLSGAAKWPPGSAPQISPTESESLRTAIVRMEKEWGQVSAVDQAGAVGIKKYGEEEGFTAISSVRIVREIGRGGTGVVYEGFDDALGRRVAIKQYHLHFLEDKQARERLKREAQAIASLSHPNVLGIYGIQQIGDDACLIQQYIDGESLQCTIRREGAIPFPRCSDLALQIAQGLAAAHSAGIVHRDLKPDNVLVEFGSGIARLCDFGLAQRAGEETITAEGVIAGTPAYMAPEQAAGGAVDHRSDLFSLGSLMYSMATAREPFGRQDPFVVMNAIRNQKHDPLDLVDPSIPSWYARLVDRLLEKQPTERPKSIQEVIQVLQNQTSPKSVAGKAKRWASKLVWTAAIATVMASGWLVFKDYRAGTNSSGVLKRPLSAASPSILTVSNGATFSRLEDAIATASDGETIQIAGDLESGRIEISGKRLLLEAAPGTRPTVRMGNLSQDSSKACIQSDSDLSLKGLRVECRSHNTKPWFDDGRFTAGIYTGQGKTLQILDCDIISLGGGICLGAGGDLKIQKSWIEGGDVGIGWFALDNICRVEESLIHSKIGIGVIYPGANMKQTRVAEFSVERSSLVTEDLLDLLLTRMPSQPVSVNFHQCVLDTKHAATLWMSPILASDTITSGSEVETFLRSARWYDSQCVFSKGIDFLIARRLRTPNRKNSAGISSLAEWSERCDRREPGRDSQKIASVQVEIRTDLPKAGSRWAPSQLPWSRMRPDHHDSIHQLGADFPESWLKRESLSGN